MWPDRKVVLPIRLLALVCLLVIADQISKAVVRTILPPGGSIPLIDGLLRITFVPNFAPLPAWVRVAFQVVLCFIVLAALPVYLFYTHTRRHSIWADIGFVGVVASVSGHLLDDFLMPFITDFIQVFNSPGANLADIYSYVGISALVVETICVFRGRRPQWKGFRHLWALEVRIWKEFVEFFLKRE
jgi:lipoprotein signal peptidase